VAIVRAFDFEPSQIPVSVLSVPPLHYHRPRRPAGRGLAARATCQGRACLPAALQGRSRPWQHTVMPCIICSPAAGRHRADVTTAVVGTAPGKTQAAAGAKAGGSTTGGQGSRGLLDEFQ